MVKMIGEGVALASGACILMSSASKFFLDGGGDTWLEQDASDTVKLVVGGTEMLRVTEDTINEGNIIKLKDCSVQLSGSRSLCFDGPTWPSNVRAVAVGNELIWYIQGNEIMRMCANRHITYGLPEALPQARAYKSANSTGQNGDVLVNCNVYSGSQYAFDLGGGFAAAITAGYSGEYKVPTTGYYVLSAGLRTSEIATNGVHCLYVRVYNSSRGSIGDVMSTQLQCYTNDIVMSTSCCTTIFLNAGDYVALRSYTGDTSYTVQGSQQFTWLSLSCIRATA
jgi:hypothetical protein